MTDFVDEILHNNFGLSSKVIEFCKDIEKEIKVYFNQVDKIAEYNQLKFSMPCKE